MPYQYNPADFAQKAWSRLSVYDGCPVATLSEMPGRPLAQPTPLAAAQAEEHAPSVQDAASSAGNRTNTDADAEPEVRWAGDWKSVSPGSRVTLAVDVEHGRVPTNEGIVDFMLNGSPIGSATPVSGRATLELPAPISATYRIDAVYSDPADGTGEGSLAWAAAEQRTLTVLPEEFALALTVADIDAALPGGAVDLRATGSSRETTTPVTGEVSFFDDGRFLGTARMEDGNAVLADISLDQESNLVTALFQGDPDRWKDPGGVSVEGDYALRDTQLTLTAASVTPIADSAGAVLVELSSDGTSAPVTGEVALYRGNDLLLELSDADEAPTRPGIAAAWSVPIAALPPGRLELTARFVGDPGVESATSVSTVVDVRPRRTEMSAVIDGSTLRLSAAVDQTDISPDAGVPVPGGLHPSTGEPNYSVEQSSWRELRTSHCPEPRVGRLFGSSSGRCGLTSVNPRRLFAAARFRERASPSRPRSSCPLDCCWCSGEPSLRHGGVELVCEESDASITRPPSSDFASPCAVPRVSGASSSGFVRCHLGCSINATVWLDYSWTHGVGHG